MSAHSIGNDSGRARERRSHVAHVLEQLPEQLRSRAYRGSDASGELAWQRPDAEEAVDALTALGYAVWGIEAWVILPDGSLYGQIPQAGGGWGVYSPDVTVQWDGRPETWDAFRQRAREETRMLLANPIVEESILPELRPFIWYEISFVSEARYRQLLHHESP